MDSTGCTVQQSNERGLYRIPDRVDTQQAQSPTAVICENAQLFGATPEHGEFDPRDIRNRDEAIGAVSEAFRILAKASHPTASSSPTNARACCGDSSTPSTPRSEGSTAVSTG